MRKRTGRERQQQITHREKEDIKQLRREAGGGKYGRHDTSCFLKGSNGAAEVMEFSRWRAYFIPLSDGWLSVQHSVLCPSSGFQVWKRISTTCGGKNTKWGECEKCGSVQLFFPDFWNIFFTCSLLHLAFLVTLTVALQLRAPPTDLAGQWSGSAHNAETLNKIQSSVQDYYRPLWASL